MYNTHPGFGSELNSVGTKAHIKLHCAVCKYLCSAHKEEDEGEEEEEEQEEDASDRMKTEFGEKFDDDVTKLQVML